jgi:hypothetical protein
LREHGGGERFGGLWDAVDEVEPAGKCERGDVGVEEELKLGF